MGEWVRCGNTSYYQRKTEYPDVQFVDPFNWAHVAVFATDPHKPKGVVSLYYRKRPLYKSLGYPDVKFKMLDEWAKDLESAKAAGATPIQQRRLFEAAPEEFRETVLKHLPEMIDGHYTYESLFNELMDRLPSEIIERDAIVIVRNSPAFGNPEAYDIEPDELIISDTQEEGVERALAKFGIYEC